MNIKLTPKERQEHAMKLAKEAFDVCKVALFEVKPQDPKDYDSVYGEFDEQKALDLIQANNACLNVPYAILVMGNVDKDIIKQMIEDFNKEMTSLTDQFGYKEPKSN